MKNQVNPEVAALAKKLTEEFNDKGLIIEAGWQAFRVLAIPKEATAGQLAGMRFAYFAGAQHLFGSLMSIMGPGEEPTGKELRRMDLIHAELERFVEEIKAHAEQA